MWNHNTYISIPFFLSGKGYGLYWDNAGRSRFEDSEDLTRMVTVKVGDIIEISFGDKQVKVEVLSIEETYKKDEAKELFKYL